MHHEFHPRDAPDPDAQISVPAEQITTELLALCEQFLRQASPIVHAELDRFLTNLGPAGDGSPQTRCVSCLSALLWFLYGSVAAAAVGGRWRSRRAELTRIPMSGTD